MQNKKRNQEVGKCVFMANYNICHYISQTYKSCYLANFAMLKIISVYFKCMHYYM